MRQAGCKALIVAHAFIAHPFVVLPEMRQVGLELNKLAANVAKLAILAVSLVNVAILAASLAALFRQYQGNQGALGISRKIKNREARVHFSDFENETKPLRKARLSKSKLFYTYSSSSKAAAISSVTFMVL